MLGDHLGQGKDFPFSLGHLVCGISDSFSLLLCLRMPNNAVRVRGTGMDII